MTLHWWMHWFWITCHLTFCILLTHSKPLSPLTTTTIITTVPSELDTIQNRPLHRPVKSIDQPVTKPQASITVPFPDTSDTSDLAVFGEPLSQVYKTTEYPDKSPCSNSNNSSIINNTLCNNNNYNNNNNKTVNPLNFTSPVTNVSLMDTTLPNAEDNDTTDSSKDNNSNSTLTSVIVTKELVSSVKIAERDHISSSSDSSLTAVSITGISFGVLVFATFVGVSTFILYRRRYLNKPQTLNDKCSNPDSSGYIDDSTMRENSEEMYSLDNDSFLNSLEAMTIQNYWTDSVKHTKL